MSKQEIVGHTSQRQALLRDLETGNVSHAYLFAGQAHVGKFTIAKWFAEQLLLIDLLEGEARDRMQHQIQRLIHPDILVLDQLWMEDRMEDFDLIAKSSNVPQQHRKKAKAKTDTISIDDIRALQERLYETGSGRYRCCLIRKIERMQAEAINALLKVVEEPPPGVVFLFTTEADSSLLPTIVSRTRVLHFSRVAAAELSPLLNDVDESDARFLLMIAQGAPGTLIHLRDHADELGAERLLHTQAVEFWESTSLHAKIQALKIAEKRTEEADRFLMHLALALKSKLLTISPKSSEQLSLLFRGLESNASRPLLLQRFAMAISG